MTLTPESPPVRESASEKMPLLDHVRELRSRIFKAVLAFAVGTVVGYVVFPWVMPLLIEPYCATAESLRPDANCTLIALRPLEPFAVRIKTAMVIGLFVGGPVIFYQLWRFITPGLTSRERRYALPFVLFSQIMFAVGLGFAYLIIPVGLSILLNLGGPDIEALLSANEYLSFYLTMSVAFGLVFELPLVLIFLSLVGVVRAATLRRARPWAVVVMVVAAAFITPTTDAVSLMFMVGPMLLFYELSILAAWLIERARRQRSDVEG